jgi:hypothetical protein
MASLEIARGDIYTRITQKFSQPFAAHAATLSANDSGVSFSCTFSARVDKSLYAAPNLRIRSA